MKIEDVLHRKHDGAVATIGTGAAIRDALNELAAHDIGALVVVADDSHGPLASSGPIAGILSERDIVRRFHEHGASILDNTVGEVMTTVVATCRPDDDVEYAMRVMTDKHIRHLPVVVDGKLIGIVSIGDVVKNRIDELESAEKQLVGYINS